MKHESHIINFVLEVSKVLSVNSIYNAKLVYNGGRPLATIYKSGEAKRTEEYIKEQVRALDVSKNFPWVNKDTLFKLTIKVIFKHGFLSKDLDNVLKLLQDGIFRALEINDSHVMSIDADKYLLPSSGDEKIIVSLQEVDKINYTLNIARHSENIWFGSEEKIEFDPIPKRKKSGVNYYMEVTDKEEADTIVYLLTNSTTLTPNLYTDIIQDLDQTIISGIGFMYIGFNNKEHNDWADEIIYRTVNSNCNRVKAGYIEDKKELLNWF